MPIALLLLALLTPAFASDPPHPRVKFGIQTPNQNVAWDDLVAIWKEADALGFDSAWVYDHFLPRNHAGVPSVTANPRQMRVCEASSHRGALN